MMKNRLTTRQTIMLILIISGTALAGIALTLIVISFVKHDEYIGTIAQVLLFIACIMLSTAALIATRK